MADIELVVKMPKELYETYKGRPPMLGDAGMDMIARSIANGTPLPAGHGRLIECEPIYDKLIRSYRADEKDYPERGKDYRVGLSNAIDLLINAPTIIEAEGE